jgi:hypothetical protein
MNNVKRNLHKYYNYKIADETSNDMPLDIVADIDLIRLRESFRQLIGNDDKERELTDTLSAVSHFMSSDSLGMSVSIYNMLNEMIRSDLLRLYIMLYDTSPQTTWISIRTINGTIRLRNYCNWFQDDMIKNYLKKNLPDIQNVSQAMSELEKNKRPKGRVPNDPRLSHLLWGTYSLLYDACTFKTPMPNQLCQFLLIYLQILGIVPLDTEIDTFWIRAQLRYIRSKKNQKTVL